MRSIRDANRDAVHASRLYDRVGHDQFGSLSGTDLEHVDYATIEKGLSGGKWRSRFVHGRLIAECFNALSQCLANPDQVAVQVDNRKLPHAPRFVFEAVHSRNARTLKIRVGKLAVHFVDI